MKQRLSLLLLLPFFLFLHPSKGHAQLAGDSIFNVELIHDLRLYFSQPGYWDSLTTYYLAGNEQMLMATAVMNGDTIDSVGVRLKGNSSYSHPNNKKSMIVDFNEYVSGQKWHGVKKVLLNNNWGDPTMMREKLAFDLCNQIGIACPRSTYGNLYLNDVSWGIYSVVEGVDKTFLGTRFPENDGNLFKAVDAFGAPGGSLPVSDLKWYGFTDADYYDHYELKTNELVNDWSDLRRLIDTLAFNPSASMYLSLPNILNVDDFNSHLAVDIMLASLDTYVGSARNFYLYHNLNSDKFEWIHWDANMAFGRYSSGGASSPTMSVTYVSSSSNRPLINKIYGDPVLKADYLNRLCELHRDYMNNGYFDPRIDSIADAIRASVYADSRKMYTNSQFENSLAADIVVSGGGPSSTTIFGLKSFVGSRDASIASQLASLGYSCVLSHADAGAAEQMSAVVYPNPFQDRITIERYSPSAQWEWKVSDLAGNIVATGAIPQGIASAEVDLGSLSSGMYLLLLTNELGERHSLRITRL